MTTTSIEFVHTTISGHRLAFEEPSGKLLKFFDRVRAAAADPKTTENDLITLVYSDENPILAPGVVPGRGMVTKDALSNPLYRVFQDLIDRKRIAEQRIDVDKMAERWSIPIADAARELGVHVSSVRQAIHSGRLASWVKDGAFFVSREALKAFDPELRGPKPADEGAAAARDSAAAARGSKPLMYRAGGSPGMSLKFKAPKTKNETKSGRCVEGTIAAPWSRVGVLSSIGEKARFFVLVPDTVVAHVGPNDSLYVRGPLKIESVENNARRAREEWDAFEAK